MATGAQTATRPSVQERLGSAGAGRRAWRPDLSRTAAAVVERSSTSPIRLQRLLLLQLRASYQAGCVTDRPMGAECEGTQAQRIAQLTTQIQDLDALIAGRCRLP